MAPCSWKLEGYDGWEAGSNGAAIKLGSLELVFCLWKPDECDGWGDGSNGATLKLGSAGVASCLRESDGRDASNGAAPKLGSSGAASAFGRPNWNWSDGWVEVQVRPVNPEVQGGICLWKAKLKLVNWLKGCCRDGKGECRGGG